MDEIARVADDWIELQRFHDFEKAPEELFERGWVLCDLAHDNPELAWAVIKTVIARYDDSTLFIEEQTEARHIVGMTAAGPLEDILAIHGPSLIDSIEDEAKRDRRISWALGCVWKNDMTDDVWTRVQRASGGILR